MTDPRVERLAELIVGYSLRLRPGQVFRIDGSEQASPLILALHRAALRAGAHAYARVTLAGLAEQLVERGSEEQLTYVSPVEWAEAELLDAWATIWADANTRSFTRAAPERHQRYIATRRKVSNKIWERISRDEVTWCGTLYPTDAHAQDAEMSLAEYENFVFAACHCLDANPAAHWESASTALRERAAELENVRELRIVAEDTD
ncbi:MAG: aminopeptidase, partial [Actinomycetota bacterium]|nr:aminopeptidase [Actinomycetota bacterium]